MLEQVEKDGATCGGCAWVFLTQELLLGERPAECLSSLAAAHALHVLLTNYIVGFAFEEAARMTKQNDKANGVEFMITDPRRLVACLVVYNLEILVSMSKGLQFFLGAKPLNKS